LCLEEEDDEEEEEEKEEEEEGGGGGEKEEKEGEAKGEEEEVEEDNFNDKNLVYTHKKSRPTRVNQSKLHNEDLARVQSERALKKTNKTHRQNSDQI
jgi:hypothetical protein